MAGTSFDMTGSVKKIFDKQAFPSGFSKREFVLHSEEDYPQDVKFECIKERCALLDTVKEGDRLRVHFNVRGNEYNERYFVNLQAWRITPAEGDAAPAPRTAPPEADMGDADLVESNDPMPF